MEKCVRCEKFHRNTLTLLGRKYCPPCYGNETYIMKHVTFNRGGIPDFVSRRKSK
jgi:hypothetical protein